MVLSILAITILFLLSYIGIHVLGILALLATGSTVAQWAVTIILVVLFFASMLLVTTALGEKIVHDRQEKLEEEVE